MPSDLFPDFGGVRFVPQAELDARLDEVRASPKDEGRLELIVCRPRVDAREVREQAVLDVAEGLVGDSWRHRASRRTSDGKAHPDMQLNVMNARAMAALSPDRRRWPLAGDQLLVDLDLSAANLPPGTRLAIDDAVIEVTAMPHTGCQKFADRYGVDARQWVNSEAGRRLNLRGINAKVVTAGTIRTGSMVRRVTAADAI